MGALGEVEELEVEKDMGDAKNVSGDDGDVGEAAPVPSDEVLLC